MQPPRRTGALVLGLLAVIFGGMLVVAATLMLTVPPATTSSPYARATTMVQTADPGVTACKELAAHLPGTYPDWPLFSASRYPAIVTAAGALNDFASTSAPRSVDQVSTASSQLDARWSALRTACGAHGVEIPLSVGGAS